MLKVQSQGKQPRQSPINSKDSSFDIGSHEGKFTFNMRKKTWEPGGKGKGLNRTKFPLGCLFRG